MSNIVIFKKDEYRLYWLLLQTNMGSQFDCFFNLKRPFNHQFNLNIHDFDFFLQKNDFYREESYTSIAKTSKTISFGINKTIEFYVDKKREEFRIALRRSDGKYHLEKDITPQNYIQVIVPPDHVFDPTDVILDYQSNGIHRSYCYVEFEKNFVIFS